LLPSGGIVPFRYHQVLGYKNVNVLDSLCTARIDPAEDSQSNNLKRKSTAISNASNYPWFCRLVQTLAQVSKPVRGCLH